MIDKEEIMINQKVSYIDSFTRENITGTIVMIAKVLDSTKGELVGNSIYFVSQGPQYKYKIILRDEITLIE